MVANQRIKHRSVTIGELREALITAAQIVDLYGDIAVPAFEQFEVEYRDMKRRQSVVERAKLIAATGDLSIYDEKG